MSSATHILAVRSRDVDDVLRVVRFRALPAEEIARLHAAVEVVAMAPEAIDSSWTPLVSVSVVHHNYRWLTYAPTGAGERRSLAIIAPLGARGGEHVLFLDEFITATVRRNLAQVVADHDDAHVRLAGLLRADGALGLVHVASLRRGGVQLRDPAMTDPRLLGTVDLQHERGALDDVSASLVDFLVAL